MDKDRMEGAGRQVKGAVKDAAGKITGDKKLQAEGYTLEIPYREMPQLGGLKLAFLVDPFGARIELTEGLTGK